MPPGPAIPMAALRRLAAPPPDATDDDLLRRFSAERDDASFAVLVRRHGGLVLDVCRSVLRNEADAEDSFQATFLALAADARRVRCPAALAGWLHAVACRTAGKARRARNRRQAHESRVPARPDVAPQDPSWIEVRQAIHEEVNRLPDRYRAAIVLFYLAGRTQDEVGRTLGLSTAGAKKRLERGRALLRSALDKRGFGPAVVLAAAAVTVPAPTSAQITTATDMAIRFVTRDGLVPTAVLSLVSSGVQPMSAKIIFGATVVAGFATTAGLGVLLGGPQAPRSDDSPVAAQVKSPEVDGPPGPDRKAPRRVGDPVNKGMALTAELDRFRALEPTDRLKFIEKRAGDTMPFTAAKRDDLVAMISERGSIEPARHADLVCQVKARDRSNPIATTILWVMQDGSLVKKGDRVVQLDDSAIRDELEVVMVKVKEAQAALVRAEETIRLVQRESDVAVRLAAIDVKLAEHELKNPPKETSKVVLELKVEQANLKRERAQARGTSLIRQAEADKHAKVAQLELESQRFKNLKKEQANCELVAPSDGMLIYPIPASNRMGGVTIAPGESVREGQKLVRVADLKDLVITTRVHEAQISRVRDGQSTQVRVDAFPALVLRGKVTQVSPVASVSDWQRADIKVYPVSIAIENAPPGLKPGMSGGVQIVTGERKAVVQVPPRAIVNVGKDRICFVKSGQELVERKVVVGISSPTAVEITQGLSEGDVVVTDLPALLTRP